jgi:adhesin/invasin
MARQPSGRERASGSMTHPDGNRHDELVRGSTLAAAGLMLTSALGLIGQAAAATAATSPDVTTVASGLSAPSGLALDAAGDLFVADTDHCRVMMLAAQTADLYGQHERPGRLYDVAGRTCARGAALRYPTGLAVNSQGDLFIAEGTSNRVVMVRPHGSRALVDIAGTGHAGYNGDSQPGSRAELNQPDGLALDPTGDLFIADTANCRVREVPSHDVGLFGQTETPLSIYTVAGTGVCGSAGRGAPTGLAQLFDPVGVATDGVGDVFIADKGDQSVLEDAIAGVVTVVAGGTGSNGPYLSDGLSATGVSAELNDAEGIALGPTAMYITDGALHAVRVVPFATTVIAGRAMTAGDMYTLAGALPVTTSAGLGNGTQWVLTHLGRPTGIVVAPDGAVFVSDAGTGRVLEIR